MQQSERDIVRSVLSVQDGIIRTLLKGATTDATSKANSHMASLAPTRKRLDKILSHDAPELLQDDAPSVGGTACMDKRPAHIVSSPSVGDTLASSDVPAKDAKDTDMPQG